MESELYFRDTPKETKDMKRLIYLYIDRAVEYKVEFNVMSELSVYYHLNQHMLVGVSDLIREAQEYDIFSRLENVANAIERVYEKIVKDEYGEKSPLVWMDEPGDHIFIGLFARYFYNVTSVPVRFHQYVAMLADPVVPGETSLVDKEYSYPYYIPSKGDEWNDTLLFPHKYGVRMQYVEGDATNNVRYLDRTLRILEQNKAVLKHVARNIIKGRFIVRKYAKNEEMNKTIKMMMEYRMKIIDEFYEVREMIYKKERWRTALQQVSAKLPRVQLRITNRAGMVTQETVNILRNIDEFMKSNGKLDENLLIKYPGLYSEYIKEIKRLLNN